MRSPEAVLADRTLAVQGGTPRIAQPPVEDTGINRDAADDVAAVVRTGRTCYWGGGPKAKAFERSFADHVGRRHGFFHSSGTAALHTALFALGVGADDEVVLGASGFVAAANVVHHLGARPVFVPTDPVTLLSIPDVSPWVGERTVAALITHFFGNVVDVEEVLTHLPSYVPLVEDAGQAHGALLRGRPLGSFGAIGSFAGSHKKLVAAGQGGINVHDDDDVDARMRMYAHHGKDADGVVRVAGHNFRGGEMEATLAASSLPLLDERTRARNATSDAMREVLEGAGITCAAPTDVDCRTAWFDLPVILDEEWVGHRDRLAHALQAEGVEAWVYPSLIQVQWVKPYLERHGWWGEREHETLLQEAALWDRVLVLPTQVTVAEGIAQATVVAEVLS